MTQLHESQELFRLLIDASSQIVWITNAEGLVNEDSPSWRGFTGQTFEEWSGEGWLDAIHPDDREATMAAWKKAISSNSDFRCDYRLQHHTGGYRWTQVRGVAQYRPDGTVKRWVGMNIDIDQQRRAASLGRIPRATRAWC